MTALRRNRRPVPRSAWTVLLAIAAIGWASGGCRGGTPAAGDSSLAKAGTDSANTIPGLAIPRLRECPHDWRPFIGQVRGGATDSGFRAVGARTNVPEYHDCQKFIDRSDYRQLVAIFASVTLSRTPAELAAAPASKPVALGSALILNFDEPYKNLGLESGFNCLYVYYGGGAYKASVKPFGDTEPDCQPPEDFDELPTQPKLDVRENQLPGGSAGGYNAGDVPPVARWDYDAAPGRATYYAGLKCGARWCEVGPQGFNPSLGQPAPVTWPKTRRRVREIKGWNDYQRLAVKGTTSTYPSDLAAYVIPDGDLWKHNRVEFDKKWVRMASVELSGSPGVYRTKLGLGPPSPTRAENTLWMCNGDWATCLVKSREPTGPAAGKTGPVAEPICKDATNPKTWWAVIVDPLNDVAYRCVFRTDHGTIPVPATARWRWVIDDETIWVRCANGCCQVDQTDE